jgi:hypothetical protein
MGYEEISAEFDKNWKALEKTDLEAKKKGTLLGRYISESYADGSAIYRIVKVGKNTVTIQVVTGIGDDWEIPYWGKQATIKKSYAEQNIGYRDRMAEIFKSDKR